MNHYTYLLIFEDRKMYIGVRSCKIKPEEDTSYLGSSKYTKGRKLLEKVILEIFKTREEALSNEIFLHERFDVVRSSDFLNRAKQTSTKFDTTGLRLNRTQEHNAKIKAALSGRKRSEAECLAISKAKKGIPRKPHSEETRMKMSESRRGFPGYKKGEKYDPAHHREAYRSRTKYSGSYTWIHEDGRILKATCMEMGQMFPKGIKPTAGFRRVVQGTKSWLGWRLHAVETNESTGT